MRKITGIVAFGEGLPGFQHTRDKCGRKATVLAHLHCPLSTEFQHRVFLICGWCQSKGKSTTVCFRSALYGYLDRELSFHILDVQPFLTMSLKLVFWGGESPFGRSLA